MLALLCYTIVFLGFAIGWIDFNYCRGADKPGPALKKAGARPRSGGRRYKDNNNNNNNADANANKSSNDNNDNDNDNNT